MKIKKKLAYSTLQRKLRELRIEFFNLDKRFQDMLLHNQRDNAKIEWQAAQIKSLGGSLESKANLINILQEELSKRKAKIKDLERDLIVAKL